MPRQVRPGFNGYSAGVYCGPLWHRVTEESPRVLECLQQPRARSHGFYRSCCFIARSPKKGNEIQRCWRLYELSCRASNGPDLLIRHASIISYS
jgi:hypothetical protein